MNIESIKYVYLIGIGGIGMSAVARYFKANGKIVAGYDKTETVLTKELQAEGIDIHFKDNLNLIPQLIKENNASVHTLIVYTPAVPFDHKELNYFKSNNYFIQKRSEILGTITKHKHTIAIAGTHGKTTVTTMVSHILKQSDKDCSAFLGGISKNYNSNLLISTKSNNIVVEADEYDRSFLQLMPSAAVITSVDADHLDIYSDKESIVESFEQFVNQIVPNGFIVIKKNVEIKIKNKNIKSYTYSLRDKADFYTKNIKIENGLYVFDVITPNATIKSIKLGYPGIINVENAVAAISITSLLGVEEKYIKKALATFSGVKRRFDFHLKTDKVVLIDDYAHHPEELKASISSIRELYPNKKITGIFQPHLYSRTRDFAFEFAQSLDLLDELFLLDIYPARELPIKGVSSEIIFNQMKITRKTLCDKSNLLEKLKRKSFDVVMIMGAGDIDTMVLPVKEMLEKRIKRS